MPACGCVVRGVRCVCESDRSESTIVRPYCGCVGAESSALTVTPPPLRGCALVRPSRPSALVFSRAFGESGLLENEPTAPAEQAHTTRRQRKNRHRERYPRAKKGCFFWQRSHANTFLSACYKKQRDFQDRAHVHGIIPYRASGGRQPGASQARGRCARALASLAGIAARRGGFVSGGAARPHSRLWARPSRAEVVEGLQRRSAGGCGALHLGQVRRRHCRATRAAAAAERRVVEELREHSQVRC